MNVAQEILAHARRRLERGGVLKGTLFRDKRGRYMSLAAANANPGNVSQACSVGALTMAQWELEEKGVPYNQAALGNTYAYQALQKVIRQPGARGPAYKAIPMWNDDPRTSAEDVILAFKKAEQDA